MKKTEQKAIDKRPLIGVGVIIRRDGKVLLGKRKGAHGKGTWSFPGGHLEFGESVADCAQRETLEETGLTIERVIVGPYTEDVHEGEGKHYVTLFVMCDAGPGAAKLMEPEKWERWEWFDWGKCPVPLFLPIVHLRQKGFDPFAK